jgi:OFA family oxalate/formate antiporter-like MFS transporter
MPANEPKWRWLVLVFAIAYCAFTYGLVCGGFTFWVDSWVRDFKAPRSLIMSLYTAASLMMVVVAPMIGRALDVLSVRAMLAIGAVIMAVGLALGALAPNFWLLFAVYATIIPFGAALAGQLPAVVLNVRLFPGRTGLINGLMGLALALSAMVMAAYSSPLIETVGWRATFLISAAVMAGVVAPVGWLLMNVDAGAPVRSSERAASHGTASVEGFDALKQPTFWIMVLATLPLMLPLAAMAPNLAAIGNDAGLDAAHIRIMVSALALGAAAGSLVGGWLVDRLPSRVFYAGIFTAVMLAMIVMTQRHGWMVATPALAALGLAGGSMMPWIAAMVMRCYGPAGFARVIGLLTPFFIPATFAPIPFGWIRDTTGSYQMGFLVFAILAAPSGLTLFLLRPAAKPVLAPAPAE